MLRKLVILFLGTAFLVAPALVSGGDAALAATTVKSSKSNTSDRLVRPPTCGIPRPKTSAYCVQRCRGSYKCARWKSIS